MEENIMFNEIKEYYSLLGRIKFEMLSLIGRIIFKYKGKVPLNKEVILMDLGSGTNYTPGWVHVDFYKFRNPLKLLKNKNNSLKIPEVQQDLRYPINCPDNSIDGVYTSHTLEHLLPTDVIKLLKEVYRILKPGCYVRVIVPDLEIAINYYNSNRNSHLKSGCEMIMDFTQNWGHISAWDEVLLKRILNDVGFVEVQKVAYGEGGKERRLIKETETNKPNSIVIEGKKPSF